MCVMMFMAGVEINPGPTTCAKLAILINNLAATVTADFLQCNTKLNTIVADVNDLKVKQAALEDTVNKLSIDRDNLFQEVGKLSEPVLIPDVKYREKNLVTSGLLISEHVIDGSRVFLGTNFIYLMLIVLTSL